MISHCYPRIMRFGPGIYRLIQAAALVLAFTTTSISAARADFIQTSSGGVYQSSDGRTKVIVGNNDGAQGIFVLYLKNPIAPQEFNAERIPTTDAAHLFVRFDPSAQLGYSEIVVGARAHKVVGNLTILLNEQGTVAVNIDNTNPYLSITSKGANNTEDSILGFYGLTEVVKGTGNVASILTANQLNASMAKVIKPYLIKDDGLFLGDKPVATPNLGVFIKHEHECLLPTTSVITLAQLSSVQKTKPESQQGTLLEKYLKENQRVVPTKGHLVLRADQKAPVIMLNIRDKNILDLRAIKNSVSSKKVCVLSPVQ